MTRCVWYISKYVIPPGVGSAGGRGFLLMRELAVSGIRALIITSDSIPFASVPRLNDGYLLEHRDGLELLWVRTFKYSVAKSLRRVLSWLHFEWRLFLLPKKELPRPDTIVVSSLSLLTIFNGLLLRARYRCRLVFEVRDIWPLTLTEEGGFSRRNLLVKILGVVERLAYERADIIVGTMPNLREHVQNVTGQDYRVECIPMGYDCRELVTRTETAADPRLFESYSRQFIPNGKFIVAHVGSIGITNALEVFLECARRLVDHPRIHFLLVGEGDLKRDFQLRYGWLSNVTFADRVDKAVVPAVLARCDLLYFSTHRSEVWRYGQSLNKVVDYMLAGKPIIASYSGFPSMVNEANCGAFVPAGDAETLARAITDFSEMQPEHLLEVGARARKWIIDNRSYRKLAEKYRDILLSSS